MFFNILRYRRKDSLRKLIAAVLALVDDEDQTNGDNGSKHLPLTFSQPAELDK